jgi:ribosomal protein L12E/L44/L45/RPP1/RPP2
VSTHPQSAVPPAAATAGRAIDGTTQEEDRRKTEEDRRKTEEDRRKTEESSVFP